MSFDARCLRSKVEQQWQFSATESGKESSSDEDTLIETSPATDHAHTSQKETCIKKSFSSQGKGIVRVREEADVLQQIEKLKDRCVVQQFQRLSPISDIRLLMIGEQVVGSMRRVIPASNSSEFRANLSLDAAAAEHYAPPPKLIELARDFMRRSQLDFTGLDFLELGAGFQFLESNLSPGLEGISALDIDIPKRVLEALYQRALAQ